MGSGLPYPLIIIINSSLSVIDVPNLDEYSYLRKVCTSHTRV